MVNKASAWVMASSLAVIMMALAGLPAYYYGAGAAAYTVSDEASCLSLPAKVRWEGPKCIVQEGTLALSVQDRLAIGPGITLFVESNGRLINSGALEVQPGAALVNHGRVANSGNLTNTGTFTNTGVLVNSGVASNTADAMFKNSGRVANSGKLENLADAMFTNTGRVTSGAGGSIENESYIDNRGIMTISEKSKLVNSDRAAFRNTGRTIVYCNSEITGTIAGRAITDKCDDPPSAKMEAWSPYNPAGYDGTPDSEFTFFASAADDVRLARLEWDFDGDGNVDATKPVIGKAAKLVNATFSFGIEGTFYPQVRAVDGAGIKSPWAKYSIAGKDAPLPLKVAASNLPPRAENMTVATEQGKALAITLKASDEDGDKIAFSVVSGPSHGKLAGDAPELTYTPDASYVGADLFTFKATDGVQESRPATVLISIVTTSPSPSSTDAPATQQQQQQQGVPQYEELPDNAAPVAFSQSVATNEDVPASVTIAATDADGDWLEYSIVSEPQHGFLSGAAPSFTYMPDAEYGGPDSFAFVASDSFGGRSAPATVTITVVEVNDMPSAYGDSATTDYGTPVIIDVLANDEDIETEVLSIVSTSSPQGGTVTVAGSMITYTPNSGFSGTDSFSYTVSDGSGGTTTAAVSVTVNPAPAAQSPQPQEQQQQPSPPPPPAPEPQPVPQPPPPAPTPPPATELYCGREASSFANIIRGTEGDDELKGTEGDDLIIGFGGNDILRGKGGNDCLIGGAGEDRMFGDRGQDWLEGGDGEDKMWGGAGEDKMWGGSGNDRVIGDDGEDQVYGDGGDDRLWGGAGEDKLYGGDGADKLVGDSGNDLLSGDGGDDILYDKEGNDTLDGGAGTDKGYDREGTNQIVNCERT